MITKLKEIFASIEKWISPVLAVLVAILTGVFLFEKKKREEAELAVVDTRLNVDRAVLEEKTKESIRRIEDLRNQLEIEKNRKVTDEELVEALRKI